MTRDQEQKLIEKLEGIINTLDSLNNKVSELKQRITALEKESAGCSEHPADDR